MTRFGVLICVAACLFAETRGEATEYVRGSASLGWDPTSVEHNSFRDEDNRFVNTPCYRDDSEADSCIKNLFIRMLPDLADGYEPYGVPPVDPLVVNRVNFAYASSLLGGSVDVSDIYTKGISKAKIMDLEANVTDPENFRILFEAFYPKVEATGNYKLAGNVAKVPIKTNGSWHATFDDATVLWEIKGAPMQKGDNVVLNLTRFGFRTQPQISKFKVRATNLIPGSKELNDIAVEFVNQNWKIIYDQMYPFMETKISDDIMIEWANIGLSRIPFDTLLPLGKQTSK